MNNNYRMQSDYDVNRTPKYYLDEIINENVVWQPEVYALALNIMKDAKIGNLIDIGSGNGEKLKPFLEEGIQVHVFDFGENLKVLGEKYKMFSNLTLNEVNLETDLPNISDEIIEDSVVVASDVIEHVVEPHNFLQWFSKVNTRAKYILVSAPDRDRIRGYGSNISPDNKAHVREWNLSEFLLLLNDYSIKNIISGYTIQNTAFPAKSTFITIFGQEVPLQSPQRSSGVLLSAIVILEVDTYALTYLDTYLQFWESQNIELLFVLDNSHDKDILKGHINPNSSHVVYKKDFSLDTWQEENNYKWVFKTKIQNYIYAPWFGDFSKISLGNALLFIEAQGYAQLQIKYKYLYKDHYYLDFDPLFHKIDANKKTYPLVFLITKQYDDTFNLYTCNPLNSLDSYYDNFIQHISPKVISSNALVLQTLLADKEKEVQKSKQTIEYIMNSKIWKATAPFRKLMKLIK